MGAAFNAKQAAYRTTSLLPSFISQPSYSPASEQHRPVPNMHFSLSAIAVVASTLLPSAYANFDVYRVKSIKPYAQGGTSLGWMIFAAEPSCDTVVKRATTNGWWESSNDVSGNKYGFRCEGDGCRTQSSPSDVDILEMNLNSVHHYSESFRGLCRRAAIVS